MADGSGLPPGVRFVDAFVIDVNGIPRGKRLPAEDWTRAARSGVAFSASALVLDAQGNAQGPLGIGTQDGDPDGWGKPVVAQTWPVPWAVVPTAQSLLSMQDQGGALWFDPRHVLAHIVARLGADGLRPVVACELEFYLVTVDESGRPSPPLARNDTPNARAGHLCLQRVEDHGAFLHRLHDALAMQGIAAGTLVSEYGPGQFEVNLPHTPDPLLSADQAVLFRRAAHGVAASMGQRVTFMAKPYHDHPGNGLHVHVSLVDAAGNNRFGADGGQSLLECAVGGMQAMLAESMAIFAPSFSAYRRYRAGAFVSTEGAWGENDRRAAFRIPTGGNASRRIEHRVACADASPHLVMACILAGLHHGITQTSVPVDRTYMPRDVVTALARLEASALLAPYLPSNFIPMFSALKRAELANLFAEIGVNELGFYL